jgi:hypothetical protein
VSSILDALERIEATGGPQPSGGDRSGRGRRRWWRVVLLFLVAIGVGAGTAALLLRPTAPAETTASTGTPVRMAQLPSASTLPSPSPTMPEAAPDGAATTSTLEPSQPPIARTPRGAAPVPAPKTEADRPWAWDAQPVVPAPEPPPRLAVARAEPHEPAPPKPSIAPAPPPPAPDPGAMREPPEARPGPGGGNPPMGAPRLRVSFLVYSSVAERRTVALTIDGGGLTTLREGDEAQGVQVVRIRPDRVDLRWQGETFTLEVRS